MISIKHRKGVVYISITTFNPPSMRRKKEAILLSHMPPVLILPQFQDSKSNTASFYMSHPLAPTFPTASSRLLHQFKVPESQVRLHTCVYDYPIKIIAAGSEDINRIKVLIETLDSNAFIQLPQPFLG